MSRRNFGIKSSRNKFRNQLTVICATHVERMLISKVKSGIFGQTAKFGQPPCLFHSSVIGIKNKLTKQTVKKKPDETAHKEPSHLDFHCLQTCVRIYQMSEFTRLFSTLNKMCGTKKWATFSRKIVRII